MTVMEDASGATLRAEVGSTGHVVSGQYDSYPAGIYRVDFELALAERYDEPDQVCAILDVCCDDGRTVLLERRILAGDLDLQARSFSLLVEFSDIRDRVERRIYCTGRAALTLGQTPRIRRVSGVLDQVPQRELAEMDPAALAADTRRILRRLEPRQLERHEFVRLGNSGDGGYVCVDDWQGIDTAFSFGINDDISWDRDAADRGLRIYQFDHTVQDPAPDDDRMVFEAKMIAPHPGEGKADLATLVQVHDKGNRRPNIVLKSDIEGHEWAMFEATPTAALARIAWIVCELHYFQGLANPRFRPVLDNGLEKLSEMFALVHVHSNVWGGYSSLSNIIFPNVIEATFVNRHLYETSETRELFPTKLDRTCDPRLPDFYLGAFRF